jgi:hypothetical protein
LAPAPPNPHNKQPKTVATPNPTATPCKKSPHWPPPTTLLSAALDKKCVSELIVELVIPKVKHSNAIKNTAFIFLTNMISPSSYLYVGSGNQIVERPQSRYQSGYPQTKGPCVVILFHTISIH